jgi:hypothetical protein
LCITDCSDGGFCIDTSTDDGGNLLIVRHVPADGRFVALRVQEAGAVRAFRRGTLLWSERENEWFVGADTVDYGVHSSSIDMEREFRAWTMQERGY